MPNPQDCRQERVRIDPRGRAWPDYAAVWRWHFYAGLFCLPFFCWLAITGSVYLFRPDVEAWLDRPYESLRLDRPRATPAAEAAAAVSAVPGAVFSHYEPPATPDGAAQIVVAQGGHMFRVYIHPTSLKPMSIGRDDHRLMELVAHLHGQLLLGDRGSMVMELVGSWGVVMILTGFTLWLPRGSWRLGGLVYPRLGERGRLFWRDLHAVAGLWISVVTLFLLLSGLPWAANWGNYLTWARNHWSVTAGAPDWPVGAKEEPAPHVKALPPDPPSSRMPGMSAAEMAAMAPTAAISAGPDLAPLDRLVQAAERLHLPRPVWISPPGSGTPDWTIASRAQDRPLRVTYAVAPATGTITGKQGFAQENVVDRVVNTAVAIHEGQLFGRMNQATLLLNAIGVLLLATSAAILWWRRRPAHRLGAPAAGARPRFSVPLAVSVLLLGVLLPLFGVSLVLVLALDRLLLARLPATRRWLGLARPGSRVGWSPE